MRFLEGQNRNESSQGQEDLKFKTILNCQSTPFKLSLQRKWNLILVARNILTIHNSQASEGAIQETASSKNIELESAEYAVLDSD